MAKKDTGAEELANMKHSAGIAKIRLETAKDIANAESKITRNKKEQRKAGDDAVTAAKAYGKLREDTLTLEQKISKKAKEQEGSLLKQAVAGGALLGVTQKIQDAVKSIGQNQRATANEMGITLNAAAKLNKKISKTLGYGKEDRTNQAEILEIMHAQDGVMKRKGMYDEKSAKNLAIVANKLNISRSEAAKLTGEMQMVDGTSAETANNTLLLAKNLADAKGVKFGAVMKDVSVQGKSFANWSGMSLKNMMRTAIETRKMGFELSDAMNVANKLLDIEGSIESQMKFNVLTGKDANFDKARALMLEGKHAEALEEVRDQVGDISKLNMLEVQSLEQATGLTRDKLMTSTTLAETAAENLDTEQAAVEAYNQGKTELAEQVANKEIAGTADELAANRMKNIETSLASQLTNQRALMGVSKVMQGIQAALAVAASIKAIAEISAVAALSWGVGLVAVGAGIAYGVSKMKSAQADTKAATGMQDGVIGSDGGMIVSGPKGSIQLDKDDSIIAGTNLGGGGGSSAVAQKLDVVIQLLSQQRVLNVSGTQLAEVMDLERIPVGMG